MKLLIGALLFFFLSPIALSGFTEDYDPRVETSLDTEFMATSTQCELAFILEEVAFFDTKWAADDWCRKVHSTYKYSARCFVRQHSANFYEANFTHRGVFRGGRFSEIFGQYQSYIGSRKLYNRAFDHKFRFFNCSSRSYP